MKLFLKKSIQRFTRLKRWAKSHYVPILVGWGMAVAGGTMLIRLSFPYLTETQLMVDFIGVWLLVMVFTLVVFWLVGD